MLDELLNEINELKEYKKKYENQRQDKKRMSDRLYKLELERYNSKTTNEHREEYILLKCKSCRNYYNDCDCIYKLPTDINKPIPSDKEWFPSKIGCKDFEWS